MELQDPRCKPVGFKTNDSGSSRDKPLHIRMSESMHFGVARPFKAPNPDDHLAGAKPDQEHDLRRAPLLVLGISGVSASPGPGNRSPSKAPTENPKPTFRVLPIPNHQTQRQTQALPAEPLDPTMPVRSGKNKTITTGWVNLVDEKDIPRPEAGSRFRIASRSWVFVWFQVLGFAV